MKLSIVIADTHALPSAFVVYRGFEKCIPKAAQLGYHGVELALKRAGEINTSRLQQILKDHDIEVSCISTGQVYADGGLMLTQENRAKRAEIISIFKELIDLAENFGGQINIGRVRGKVGKRNAIEVEQLFVEVTRELCEYARSRNVILLIEPVNRYETDFINTVEEGAAIIEKVGMPNLMVMPDVFHMNIEDKTIADELVQHIDHINYIHFADSNRLAPGQGHIDFDHIFTSIYKSGFDGWISAEILPYPNPDMAAKQAALFLLPRINHYNKQMAVLSTTLY
ncbi:TIM barrel protein [Flavitalea antarctica]